MSLWNTSQGDGIDPADQGASVLPDPWSAVNDRGGEQLDAGEDPWSARDDDTPPIPASASPDAEMYSYLKVVKLAVHGQGEVWKVVRPGSDRFFAQKFLLEETPGETDLKRFHREVRTQSGLVHRGIMPIYAVDFDASPPWFVMPLADHSLRDRLRDGDELSEDVAVAVIMQVAAALGHAHREGVIHRDVKPENILWLNDRWVVADFGLCRDHTVESTTVTRTGIAIGTVAYMAPEQWDDSHNVGVAADIYAVGKVLYECLTGHIPWPSPRPALVPDRFKYVVNKCLEADPERRYTSLDALVVDLKALSAPADLLLPMDHAKALAGRVAEHDEEAAAELAQFILRNLSDEVFLRNFLPSVTPPVLAMVRYADISGFHQIVHAFDQVASGDQAFSWTDSAATFLERVFQISDEAGIRELVLKRILILGTEHSRWAVRTIYMRIITGLHTPEDVLMVATQLASYPDGAAFVRDVMDQWSLPLRIREALAA